MCEKKHQPKPSPLLIEFPFMENNFFARFFVCLLANWIVHVLLENRTVKRGSVKLFDQKNEVSRATSWECMIIFYPSLGTILSWREINIREHSRGNVVSGECWLSQHTADILSLEQWIYSLQIDISWVWTVAIYRESWHCISASNGYI